MNEQIEIGLDTLKVEGEASKLYEALAKAQVGFHAVPKSADGQIGTNRGFKYADYATLIKCVRPALAEHGIALLQPLHSRDGRAVTTTIIAGHGASITSSFSFKPEKNDPQEFGRHHTYYRRYQLQAMLGLAGDSDADDPPMAGVQYQEQATPPKEASAGKKPAAAKVAPNGSPAKSSEASTAPTVTESKPTSSEAGKTPEKPADTRTMSEKLIDGMKQKGWKMSDVQAFYEQHVDPAGFTKPDNLTRPQRELLWSKMIEVAGVIPF